MSLTFVGEWYLLRLRSFGLSFSSARAFRASAVMCAAIIIAMAGDARAQSASDLERGRSLFRQALSMEVAGDWTGALSRLEDVARIKTTPQVRFHLARCKEHLGRLTEALGDYRLAEYEATQLNAAELAEMTLARQGLEVRVPKITVTLSPSLANSTVELDGIVLGMSGLGNVIPVNPGEHQLVVHTRDGQSFVRVVRATEGTMERIQLEPPPGFVRTPPNSTSPSRHEANDFTSPRPAWVWVVGGIGVAGIVTGSVLWYVRERAIDDLNNGCQGSVCPTSLKSTQTRGEQASVAAPIALGVGVLGVGIATYGFLSSPSKSTSTATKSRATVNVSVGYNSNYAGVNVAGAF